MFDSSRDIEILNKAVRISKLPDKFRTAQELGILSSVLSKFDIFQTKVAQEQLPDVLRAAALNVKFVKVPMGQFLYHKDEPSQCIYFILKGEAWKFRPKTENELKIDSKVVKEKQSHPQKAVPKMLETVKLAKALQERTIMSEKQTTLSANVLETMKSQGSVSTIPQAARSLVTLPSFMNSRPQVLDKIIDNPSLENSINTSFNELENGEKGKDSERIGSESDAPNQRINFNSIIKKIMSKRDLLNFENDYFYNVIKRNEDLSSKYIKDKLNVMRFERKVCPGETVGELSMSLNCARTSSLLAYSNLYVLYLDQKGYENTFMNQIEEVRDKVQYFVNYFRDMKPEILKRICFFFKEQKFKIGDIIYKEDSPCDDLFFIKSGEVQLIKKVETEENSTLLYEKNKGSLIAFNSEGRHRNKPKNVIVASIVEGYFFGEEALFDSSNRNFTAKSVSNLVCYKIASKILEKLPKDVLQKLRDFAISKQTWRGRRIKDITNKSIALTISVNPSVNLENSSMNEDDKRVQTTTTTQKRFKERKGIKKLSTLERSLEKLVSPKKREVQTRQAVNLGESDSQYRFKLKSRMNKEDHNPYVLKLLPKDESANKKKPLSVWKQNIALLRERPAISLSKTTLDQKSISRSKEDYLETLPNLKSTLSSYNSVKGSIAKDIISRTLQTSKNQSNNAKSTPLLNNLMLEKGGDDLRHYLMKNLHQKFVKEFSQRNYQLPFDANFDSEPTTVTIKRAPNLEDTLQSTIREKSQDTCMSTLSDFRGKPSSRPVTKKYSLRDQKMKNQFYIKSLTTLDTSTQISSLKEVPGTMKSISQDEDKPFFTTNIQESSLLGKKMTLKIRS